MRNGPRPRTNVKILLNRRGIKSFEDLVTDISEAFGPKFKSNKVKSLFTLKGREVKGVGDVFRDDDVFVGVGNENISGADVQDIIEELNPDSPYAKNLAKVWEKNRKKGNRKYEESKQDDSGIGSEGSEDPDRMLKKARKKNMEAQRSK